MAQAQKGDRVSINYVGTLADGTIFDSTLEEECGTEDCGDDCSTDDCDCDCHGGPMELVIGEGTLFPQIEEALVGMAPGEKKTMTIAMDDAFGDYDEAKVFVVPRTDLPESLQPEVGDELILTNEKDEDIGVVVTAVSDESVTFDTNHPLAGEDLTFEVELLSII